MKPIVVKPGSRVKLAEIDPADTEGMKKDGAEEMLAEERQRIAALQMRLFAEDERALLVVLQGMDTSGKGGTVKNVFSAVNPCGLDVAAFNVPSQEELDHDFLWRIYKNLPRKGNIGVFDRSHYEDVLVVRVKKLVPAEVWKARFDQINQFEELISSMGCKVLKFFLHISREEQKERLIARLDDPAKNYKFRAGDLEDRKLWGDFQAAYEDVLEKCSTKTAPWHIVPADKKWYRNLVIAKTVAGTLEAMKPKVPRIEFDPKKVRIPD